jgi:hypothetical protein
VGTASGEGLLTSVKYALAVKKVQGQQHRGRIEENVVYRQACALVMVLGSRLLQIETQVSAKRKVHDQIQVLYVLEGVVCIAYERALQHTQQLQLLQNFVVRLGLYDGQLVQGLE